MSQEIQLPKQVAPLAQRQCPVAKYVNSIVAYSNRQRCLDEALSTPLCLINRTLHESAFVEIASEHHALVPLATRPHTDPCPDVASAYYCSQGRISETSSALSPATST